MSNKKDPFYEREAERYENPIPSREYILQVILESDKPCSREFLEKHFRLTDEDAQEALRRRLNAMLRDSQLCKTKHGFTALTLLKEVKGTLVLQRDGFGHVMTEDEEEVFVKILPRDTRGYYDGDILHVRIIRYDVEGEPIGEVIELVKAQSVQMVGRLVYESGQIWLIPLERKYTQDITIVPEHTLGAEHGAIVVAQIIRSEPIVSKNTPMATVIEVLGDPQTEGIEIKTAIRKFQLPEIFPESVEKAAAKLGKTVSAASKKDSVNLTDLPFVTIDGEDAKDFDDAVYCEALPEGGYKLYVAIADVSHYVKPGSDLDVEAQERGNSVYFPGFVIPMLPENLSNGLCSLKPKVQRLTLVCELNFDSNGLITRSKFYRAVICSAARLTYTEVAGILEDDAKLKRRYQKRLTEIENLHAIYQLLRAQRDRRGAIDFESVETQILFNSEGKIETIVPRERNIAHKIIEECMLAANVTAAHFLAHHKVPTLYRVHLAPPSEKLKAVREFLSEFGLNLGGRDSPAPIDYAKLMNAIKNRDDKHIIETVLLRSLSQAEYSPKNEGHFGLAYSAYVHFTSPIRRYPDLIVHRQIVSILEKQEAQRPEDLKTVFVQLGLNCSLTERRADDATRDAMMALKCHYMQDKVGQIFTGRITGVTSFGLFVELQSLYIDGLVHVATLGDDYYLYEPFKHRMIGEHTREVFRLGDELQVALIKVDVDDKKIDLKIVRKKGSAAPKKKAKGPRTPEQDKKANIEPKSKKKSSKKKSTNKKNPTRKK